MLNNSYCLIKRYYEPIELIGDSIRYLLPKQGDSQEEFIEIEMNPLRKTFFARQKSKNDIDFSKWKVSPEPGSATGLFAQFLYPELFSPSFLSRPEKAEYA